MIKIKFFIRRLIDNISNHLLTPIKNICYKRYRKELETQFLQSDKIITYKIKKQLYDSLSFFKTADFIPDSWSVIRHMSDFYNLHFLHLPVPLKYPSNRKLSPLKSFASKHIIDSFSRENEWIYYHVKNFEKNVLIELNVTFHSVFTEFQFDFFHKSIYERLRLMVIDNNKLVFEIVSKGFFFTDLRTVPFSFELNKKYNVRIIILENAYSFVVDNKTIMTVEDKKGTTHNCYDLAFILWDNKPHSDIHITIQDFNIFSIQ